MVSISICNFFRHRVLACSTARELLPEHKRGTSFFVGQSSPALNPCKTKMIDQVMQRNLFSNGV